MKIIRKDVAHCSIRKDGRKVTKLLEMNIDSFSSSMVLYHCDVPKGEFAEHYHAKSTELIFFPEGGKIKVNGKLYDMNPWDGVLLEPGDRHGYNESECKDIIHFAIRIPSEDDKVEV